MSNETWKDLEDYYGIYQVSNTGKVKVLDRLVIRKNGNYIQKGKELSIGIDSQGYGLVSLTKDRKMKSFRMHRLVASHFVSRFRETDVIVNHKDGNKLNNNSENLEWCDYRHNLQHAYDTGLRQKGPRDGRDNL